MSTGLVPCEWHILLPGRDHFWQTFTRLSGFPVRMINCTSLTYGALGDKGGLGMPELFPRVPSIDIGLPRDRTFHLVALGAF